MTPASGLLIQMVTTVAPDLPNRSPHMESNDQCAHTENKNRTEYRTAPVRSAVHHDNQEVTGVNQFTGPGPAAGLVRKLRPDSNLLIFAQQRVQNRSSSKVESTTLKLVAVHGGRRQVKVVVSGIVGQHQNSIGPVRSAGGDSRHQHDCGDEAWLALMPPVLISS